MVHTRAFHAVAVVLLVAGCRAPARGESPPPLAAAASPTRGAAAPAASEATMRAQVLRGRELVIVRDCGACHGGYGNPAADGWLAGRVEPDSVGPFRVQPRNLTPDDETGLGLVSERRIFNALRYGLRPQSSPDEEITSHVPGTGNHPAQPDYLAPSMPWVHWRFMPDEDLRAIAAYLKRGVAPVRNPIPPSEGPPDRWASEFTSAKYGSHELPPFPTEHEQAPPTERLAQVVQGRAIVAAAACSACHGGIKPSDEGWLAGIRDSAGVFRIGPFVTRPRNITPHTTTGMGRFTERQIFNALRYGLRPGETPDVEITSSVPGEGNHPASPKYLAPPMPWPAFRHMTDDQLRAVAAYLKHGVKPVHNRVADSDGPPDFWRSEYTAAKYGTNPPPPFPTAREVGAP